MVWADARTCFYIPIIRCEADARSIYSFVLQFLIVLSFLRNPYKKVIFFIAFFLGFDGILWWT